MHIAFGLTNGFWDIVYDTRISPEVRRVLYGSLRVKPMRRDLAA
jgi:hypothetical protein